LKNNLGKTLFCLHLFLPDSWDALSTDSLPEAPEKRTGISMRDDDAEIIWRIKTPTHTTSKHGSPGRCADLLQTGFLQLEILGIRICPHVHVQIPLWTIDAHVACE
jgi:hypothetical protein